MKLQNFQYFEKLIELKSYSKVADFFNVGQPTISMGIKRLEESVGYDLIVHKPKHNEFILTPGGKEFHKYSEKIVEQLTLLNHEINRQLQRLSIDVGMTPMINNTYFSKLASKLNEKTLSNLNIVNNNSNELIKMLRKGDINLALLETVKPIKSSVINSEILTKDEFKALISNKNKLSLKKKINLTDLDAAKVIQMTDGFVQSDILTEIRKKQLASPEIVYRTRDPKQIERLVKENVGISLLLKKSIDLEDGVSVVDLDIDKIPEVYISLAWRNENNPNELEHNLIDTICELSKSF